MNMEETSENTSVAEDNTSDSNGTRSSNQEKYLTEAHFVSTKTFNHAYT